MPSVQKDGTQWLKRVLLPLWLIRIAIMGLLLVGTILGIAVAAKQVADFDPELGQDIFEGDGTAFEINWNAALGVFIAFFLFCFFALLLDLLCVVKFLRHTLTPRYLLITSVIQTTLWTLMFALQIWDVTRGAKVTGLIGSLIVLAISAGLLIYAFVVNRRQKRGGQRGNYQPAVNPATGGFQAQPAYGGAHAGAPYKTGAYEPYGGQATGYTGGSVEMHPQGGAADSYYNTNTAYRGSEVDINAQPAQTKPMV